MEKADWNLYRQNISLMAQDSIEDTVESVINNILEAAEISIPRQNIVPGRKTVPWWNQDIDNARRDKRKSFKEFIRSPTEARFVQFKRQRAKLRRLILESKKRSWEIPNLEIMKVICQEAS
nr:unnamed protein product [Callosobruchus chinensis]